MPSSVYQDISLWLRLWDQILSKPTEVLLGRSFANLIRIALTSLERKLDEGTKRISKAGETRLLEWILDAYAVGDPEIEFFRLAYPNLVQELEKLLAHGRKQGSYDLVAVVPIFRELNAGVPLSVLKSELSIELSSDPTADSDKRLATISQLLLHHLLTKHSVDGLKQIPEKSIAVEASRLALRGAREVLEVDNRRSGDAIESLQQALGPCLQTGNLSAPINSESFSLTETFDAIFWEESVYQFLARTADWWAKDWLAQARSAKTAVAEHPTGSRARNRNARCGWHWSRRCGRPR